jgi:guanylate kinase
MIIIISGLQGVGKTTIINELLKIKKNYKLSISATTRPKRKNEGNEYEFMDIKEFNEKEKNDYFLETVDFNGNKYGTPKHQLDKNIILNVNPSSILNFYNLLTKYKYISIFIDGPREIIKNRLLERDKGEDITVKINKWEDEIIYKKHFSYIVENLDLNKTISDILDIIMKIN